MNDEQLRKTEDLKFIISIPVLGYDTQAGRFDSKCIGVLNIDVSNVPEEKVTTFLENEDNLTYLSEKGVVFAEYCTYMT